MSTSACLCGTYALYRMLVSPLVSPGPDLLNERNLSAAEFNSNSSENHPQAEQYLPDQPWAAVAKYEIRNDPTYVYFAEWERIEQSGRVRFKPFAMIWRPKDNDPKEPPITIVCESAVVEFAEKFEITRSPGRVIGGNLEGTVRIRGPNGMAVDGRDFNFVERALRAWSDNPVAFAYGPHSGSGNGIELELIPQPGAPKEDKPAIAGVRTLRLLKDVVMDLVGEPKDNGTPKETVHVTSAGSFEFGVESHVATFQKKVRVVRPTGNDQFDKLSCEQLTLVFEPKPSEERAEAAAAVAPAAKADDATSGFGRDLDKLQFRRLRAEGANTTVISQTSELQAVMQELTYDEQARVIALRDAKQVRMLQRNNELRCPEVTAVLDEAGQIEQATCRGAGKLFSYQKDAENLRQPRGKKQIEFAAEWLKQLRMEPDKQTNLDLIEFTGQAVLSQPEKMALRADIVRLWVTPDKDGQGMRGMAERPIGAEGAGAKPKKMLALGNAEFASPKITGTTERLEVWFEEGPQPQPPTTGPADRTRKHGVLRPSQSPSGQRVTPVAQTVRANANRSVTDARGASRRDAAVRPAAQADVSDSAVPARSPRPKRGRPAPVEPEPAPAENPLHVVADRMQVQMIMVDGGDPQLAKVVTAGRVHVTQDHGKGGAPFDLRGDRLDLKNYSDTHQVIHVTGQPAHIHDRGMQLEGADIHFDRGENLARVEGPGVLRLPVSQGLDGKPLETAQLLDVFWQEKMRFDGETADFFAKVRTQLNGSEMRCEEMHVTLAQRISFSEEIDRSQETKVRLVVCRDGVRLKSHEYKENRLVEIRTAEGFEFALDQTTGNITAQGPGTLELWRRGTGNRAGLATSTGVKANRPLKTESAEWEYTRVKFAGRMNGNANEKTTKFKDRVIIVYGPVNRATDTVDEDELPLSGGWMRCDELDLTQLPGGGSGEDSMAVVGRGNAELEGRSEHGQFHAQAGQVSFDGSKGLYSLFGEGGHDATLSRQQHDGSSRGSIAARRMEFIPSLDKVNIQGASGAQGGR